MGHGGAIYRGGTCVEQGFSRPPQGRSSGADIIDEQHVLTGQAVCAEKLPLGSRMRCARVRPA